MKIIASLLVISQLFWFVKQIANHRKYMEGLDPMMQLKEQIQLLPEVCERNASLYTD